MVSRPLSSSLLKLLIIARSSNMVKVSAEDGLGCKYQPLTLKVFVVFFSAFFENSLAKEPRPH